MKNKIALNTKYLDMLVIKVGDADRPAGTDDIEDIMAQMEKALSDKDNANPILVTHHLVKFETVSIPVETGAVKIIGTIDENDFAADKIVVPTIIKNAKTGKIRKTVNKTVKIKKKIKGSSKKV